MVPLHVVDRVRRQHGVDPVEEMVHDLRPGQVEDLLAAVLQRLPAAGRQDPLGVRAVEVGVRVDHLGLEPQPELHAQRLHVADERVQPVRPDLLVDDPVAEAGGVVAPVVEPAVVEDEPLHAHPGRAIGDLLEPVEVVVEEDGLPHVEHDGLHGRVRVERPLELVPAGGQPVEALVGRRDVHPGRRVRRPGRQHDLTGQQPLAAADRGAVRGGPLDAQHRVAAPADVHADHAAAGGREPRGAGDDHGGGVETGAAAQTLTQPEPVVDGVPLGAALALVAAGEVEQLDVVVGQRQHDLQAFDDVLALGGVGHGGAPAQPAPDHRLQLVDQRQAGVLVLGPDDQPGVVDVLVDGAEPRRPPAPADPVPAQVGAGEPPACVLAEEGQAGTVGDHDEPVVVGRHRLVGHSQPRHHGQCALHVGQGDRGARAGVAGAREQHGKASREEEATWSGEAERPGSEAARALRRHRFSP